MPSAPPRPDVPRLAELPFVIDTPRLKLRPCEQTDVEDIWPYVSDPAFPRFMSWAAHKDRDETRAWLASRAQTLAAGNNVAWTIEHDGRASGMISLDNIQWTLAAWRIDRAQLGYWIAPRLAGQGLMSEAAAAVVRWGFDTLGLHKIVVGCIEDNVGSKRVIDKLGFRLVGREEEHVWRDGKWWNHLYFEMTAAEHADSARTLRLSRPTQPA